MSELLRTVQGTLREYANRGYDVLKHPQQVHLEGKPYGLVLGHYLSLYDRSGNFHLGTALMQQERPVLSSINMYKGHDDRDTHVTVFPSRRLIVKHINGDETHMYSASVEDLEGDHRGHWGNTNLSDVHEALKGHVAHTNGVPHVETKGFVQEYRTPDLFSSRPMTPADHSSFNEKEAIQDYIGHEYPYKGLVLVNHWGKSNLSTHLYDPSTEKLVPYERYYSWKGP